MIDITIKDNDTEIIENLVHDEMVKKELSDAEIRKEHNFYKTTIKDGKLNDITIDKVKLVELFIKLGFCRYDTDDDKYVMIKQENNTIRRVSPVYIRDCFFDWLDKLPSCKYFQDDVEYAVSKNFIKSKMYRSLETYFSNLLYERARSPEPIVIQKDNKDCKYFFFKNCFVKVDKEGCQSFGYSSLEHKVWETSILPNAFEYTTEKGNFERFFERITADDNERKRSLMSICGYLLHSYYDYKTFLVLLTDAGMTDDGEPNGRTGKSLLMKALGKMLNADDGRTGYTEIDGKTFKPNDERKYQRADIDTSLIHVNDIFSWFNIESLFTDITEGIVVRQMYEKPFTIWSKLAMSSNKSIKLEGVSARDRVIVFEVENYYSDVRSPESEFKQWFFRDWDTVEWNKFYSFIIRCCELFFREGIIRPCLVNYQERIIREHTAPEFIAWFEDIYKVILTEMRESNNHVERSKKFLYENFINEYIDFRNNKHFSQRRLTKWIQDYLKWKKIPYEEARKGGDVFIFMNNNIDPEKPKSFGKQGTLI